MYVCVHICVCMYIYVCIDPPPVRYGHTAIELNDIIYIFGGKSIDRKYDLWTYDTNKNTWKELTPVYYLTNNTYIHTYTSTHIHTSTYT